MCIFQLTVVFCVEKIKCAKQTENICGKSGQCFFHKTTTSPNESAGGNVISNECLSMTCFSASAQNLQCEDQDVHCRCQLKILTSCGNDLLNAPNVNGIWISLLSKYFVYTVRLN